MEALLDFAKGPLFRLTFAIMILGLARILILTVWEGIETYRRAGDKNMPWNLIFSRTVEWVVPVRRIFNNRPLYSIFSILFHVGLLLVPIFLFAHVQLWKNAIGVSWFTLPKSLADILTVTTIVFGLALLIGRIATKASNFISRKQDYLWPILLVIPFITGFVCANLSVSPAGYQFFILIHILSGELIFVLIPFTKIAHCVLMPLSQCICNFCWRFPPDTDDAVCTTLNKKGEPV
jgi:nitrate reductase gamma subunit